MRGTAIADSRARSKRQVLLMTTLDRRAHQPLLELFQERPEEVEEGEVEAGPALSENVQIAGKLDISRPTKSA